MTLRGRLLTYSLLQVLALGLVTFGAGLFMRARLAPFLDDYLRRKTERTAIGLAEGLVVALGGNEPELAQSTIAIIADDPDLVRFEVRDRKGTLLAAVGRGKLPAATGAPGAIVRDAGDALVATAPIEMEGYRLGTLTGAYSKRRLRAILDGFLVVAAAVALACLAAIAVAFRFSRSFVAPIHRMIQFSHRVKDGGLSERVAASPREGELSQLAADLNAMAEALETRDAVLAQRGRELEESLSKLRAAQEELLRSTRLASVGEMAGRTAHEVLNPMTGVQCRVALMQKREGGAMAPNIETLRDIARAWRTVYVAEGLDGLARALAQPAADGAPLVEEDLDNLEGIAGYLADAHRERAADLSFLLREGDRVVHIVDAMRSLTRASGAPARARVDELLRESIESVSDGAASRSVSMRLEGAADAEVIVDRYEFVQIVTNLLRNACLAIEDKNGRTGGQVTIATEVGADLVAVRVRDDGCGIADEFIPRLFEASFTTRSSRDGTGLGLGIARRLARGFGGELRLERSAVGQGATFLLEIPVAKQAGRGVNIHEH
jgi:two-component system, NtrC family, sensor kinase